MAVTYPLSVPSGFNVKNSSFRLSRAISQTESPFTFQQQTYQWQGERWEGEVTLVPKTYTQSAAIKAFLAKLRGKKGTFLYGDPDFLAKGANGSLGGTPLVAGSSQTGNELITDGWTALTTVLLAGDYIQLGSGSSSKLYMVVDDATTDSSGAVTLNIEPAIITAPSDNDPITVTGAKGVFQLVDSAVEWNSDKSCITEITLAFKERLE